MTAAKIEARRAEPVPPVRRTPRWKLPLDFGEGAPAPKREREDWQLGIRRLTGNNEGQEADMEQMNTITITIETIPWLKAAELIQNHNGKNRPMQSKRVDTLARAMSRGRWRLTHQGVAFDPAGNIIDGQHRLAAAARCKTDLRTVVTRYGNSTEAVEAMAIFDSGRSRSMADGLAIGGTMPTEDARELVATCNVMASLIDPMMTKGERFDLQETGEFYKAHRDALKWTMGALPGRRGGAIIRAAFALAWSVDRTKTAELAAQIRDGVGLPGTPAALWNRAHAEGLLSGRGGSTERRAVCLRALRVLRAQLTGEKTPDRLYATEETLGWFLNKLAGKIEADAVPASGTWEERVIKLLSAPGVRAEWPVAKIAQKLQGNPDHIRNLVAGMSRSGKLARVGHGVYALPKAA